LQDKNRVSVAVVCRIIACILHNVKLTTVFFDHEPSACICRNAWGSEGLPVPPSDIIAKGWEAVLRFLRVRCVCALYLNLLRAQLTPSPRPALSSPTA
jgi:hypothetical protein